MDRMIDRCGTDDVVETIVTSDISFRVGTSGSLA